ncbi:MAG: hypothetical protein EOO43_12895, partial [Flavobacterium sp.]
MANLRMLLNRFSKNLGTIREIINIENSVNDLSFNNILETKMLNVLNVSFEYELVNANLIKKNYSGVDGIDRTNKLMVQVSSTITPEKLNHTIDQILETGIYTDFDRLIFLGLSNKSKLTDAFKKKLHHKIDGKFQFNFDKDFLDLRDIYSFHNYQQDLQKIHFIVNELDEVLNYIPDNKQSGFDVIGVCFHDEELENTFLLVDAIVREGINVFITSKKLYDKFSSEHHPLKDYVIYADINQSFQLLDFCITVLSNGFIYQNFRDRPTYSCHLLQYTLENEIKTEIICFDPFLKRVKMDTDSKISSYQSIQKENINVTVKRLLSNRIKEATFGNISMDEIKQELVNTHKNFLVTEISQNSDFTLLHLKMDKQDDLQFNYMILTKDFTLNSVIQRFDTNLKRLHSRNLNVLVPKDFSHKTRRRLEGLKSLTNKVYYIDEHLFDNRYRTLEQKPILNTEDFVSPVVRHQDDLLRVNDIIHWIINNSESSVAIINGSGGLGKTTICEKIHDIILEDHERNIVIFIDASQYIEVFKRRKTSNNIETEYDLYNIFKACHPHASIIDKNSFYL